METLQRRREILGRWLALLATYAVIVGALSAITNLGAALDAQIPALGRVLVGLWGLGAGLLLWTGRRAGLDGRQTVLVWAVLQIPVIAWNTHGSPTTQLLNLPLSVSSETKVNGEVTAYSEFGINLIGVALTIWAARMRDQWTRRVRPVDLRLETRSSVYDIEYRGEAGAIHVLGSAPDLSAAERAAASQASRLRLDGGRGEVVVVEQPSGGVVARQSL
jgi:hypothetical protein